MDKYNNDKGYTITKIMKSIIDIKYEYKMNNCVKYINEKISSNL